MEKEVKDEVLDILRFYKGMLGVDSSRVNFLITEVNQISTRVIPSENLVEKVKDFMLQCCETLGYVPNEKNNLSRDPETVTERFVILRKADVEFHRSFAIDVAAMEIFGKHRTTFTYWRKSADNLIETKDILFMHKFMQL